MVPTESAGMVVLPRRAGRRPQRDCSCQAPRRPAGLPYNGPATLTDPFPARRAVMPSSTNWVAWAVLSAVFAALTAVFAKVGLEGVDSDFATLVRTAVILVALATLVVV